MRTTTGVRRANERASTDQEYIPPGEEEAYVTLGFGVDRGLLLARPLRRLARLAGPQSPPRHSTELASQALTPSSGHCP